MSLTSEEREELTNLYADMSWGQGLAMDKDALAVSRMALEGAMWAALCHTTGRCGQAVNLAYPDTPQARIYELMMKALR